jgi:hypothetical protein
MKVMSLHSVGGSYILIEQISLPTEARFNQIHVGKSLIYSFAFCGVGDVREKGTVDSI